MGRGRQKAPRPAPPQACVHQLGCKALPPCQPASRYALDCWLLTAGGRPGWPPGWPQTAAPSAQACCGRAAGRARRRSAPREWGSAGPCNVRLATPCQHCSGGGWRSAAAPAGLPTRATGATCHAGLHQPQPQPTTPHLRKPSMPAAMHSTRSRSEALAVMATMGTVQPRARISCGRAWRAKSQSEQQMRGQAGEVRRHSCQRLSCLLSSPTPGRQRQRHGTQQAQQ